MITRETIKIYRRYGGDTDWIVRAGSEKEKRIAASPEWLEIERLLQYFVLRKKGLVADSYRAEMESQMKELVVDAEAAAELERLV